MHLRRRSLAWLFPSLVALAAAPALSQNLLVNPGFDRDLSGWVVRTLDGSSPEPTADTFVAWDPADASGNPASGGASLHGKANGYDFPGTTAAVGQCVPVSSPAIVAFGARFLTRSERLSTTTTTVAFFASRDCSGAKLSSASAPALPSSLAFGSNSGGVWVPVQTTALVPATALSVFFEASAKGLWTMSYGTGWVDVVADDAFLTVAALPQITSLLPSAAWVSGASGYWSTHMTLVNSGVADAAVTLKWLGHDMDGRAGPVHAYLVPAGQTLGLNDEEWELSHTQNYGAILVTSSSSSLFLQSETSTSLGGGTVGQALPAFGPADFAGAAPKTLAPIRENAAFRTNLVLANATEIPITAYVALFAADGTQIGAQDVALPPLGMTQLSRVATLLGAPTLDNGRIAVSTPTPGGLVAAYASVIDNVTNDPRTLLPR
jgi:hypothetical protein